MCQPGHVLACRPPAVKDDDDYVAPGQPEVVADIDFAEVCQGEGEKAVRPSWYQPEYGAELMHSQVGSLPRDTDIMSLFRHHKSHQLIRHSPPSGVVTEFCDAATATLSIKSTATGQKVY